MWKVIQFGIIAILLFGCVSNPHASPSAVAQLDIPSTVSAKYIEMKDKYANNTKFGALAYYCTKAGEAIYTIHGTISSGMRGERYIYDSNGTLIETWIWDPNTGFEEPEDKIHVNPYDCRPIDEETITS